MVLVVMLVTGCSNVHVNRATLIASTAALAADWYYTRGAASAGWDCGGKIEESGAARMFIGSHPNAPSVDAYFGIAAIANAVIWMAMPKKYRSAVPFGLVAVQYDAVVNNAFGPAAKCM